MIFMKSRTLVTQYYGCKKHNLFVKTLMFGVNNHNKVANLFPEEDISSSQKLLKQVKF